MEAHNQLDLLAIRDATFIREISYHEELDSTNAKAVEIAKTDSATPQLIITSRQTAGRGRGANKWWSAEGSLTFTVLLDLPLAAAKQAANEDSPAGREQVGEPVAEPIWEGEAPAEPVREELHPPDDRSNQVGPFSLTVGLAICQAIEKFAPSADLALKWPNDVYMNEKKVCGILIEKPIVARPRLVIGVGLNVNNSLNDAPPDVRGRATSLRDELSTELRLDSVLIESLQQLEMRVHDHVYDQDALLDRWRAYCMLTGRDVLVESGADRVSGICRGVNEHGSLLVEDGSGVHRCIAGVVMRY